MATFKQLIQTVRRQFEALPIFGTDIGEIPMFGWPFEQIEELAKKAKELGYDSPPFLAREPLGENPEELEWSGYILTFPTGPALVRRFEIVRSAGDVVRFPYSQKDKDTIVAALTAWEGVEAEDDGDTLSCAEAAKRADVTERTIRRAVKQKTLKKQPNGTFRMQDVDQYIKQHSRPQKKRMLTQEQIEKRKREAQRKKMREIYR
ncbi:MAG: hypothetical protein IT446_14240 [Phycisphaerales bacterium]|nr:hypothetical protein [Phycisphaerales bacterium]